MNSLSALLKAIQPAVLDAAAAIMEVFDSNFGVALKQDQSPVTEADKRGEAILTAALGSIAPSIPVVGEEATSEGVSNNASRDGLFWLVDPLDGTKEFIRRGNDFTVNVGLIRDGAPILGMVAAPARGVLYAGDIENGAWAADFEGKRRADKRALKCRKADPDDMTIVASRSHRSPELEAWLNHFPEANHVSVGSSLKFCLLAAGEADLYPRLGPTCEWDTAAAHAILLAAGGAVLTPGGDELTYAKDTTTFLNPHFLAVADPSFTAPAIG